jgi:hypothetical protein
MSKVQLQGNASGTGVFTLASPNSNTDRTLTLPDNTGTVLTTASNLSGLTGVGKVLQVVRASSATDVTSTSATYVTALTANITPTSSSSKILVMAQGYFAVKRDQTPMYFGVNIYRNSTGIGVITQPGLNSSGFEQANYTKWVAWQDAVLDSPSTTSSTPYTIQFAHIDAIYGGYSPNQITGASFVLVLMEVAP